MNLLLDTVTFLWIIEDSPRLSTPAKAALRDAEGVVFLSAASAWEIAIKYRLGRLPLPKPPEKFIPEQRKLRGIETLDIVEAAVVRSWRLPDLHKDAFDRVIASQAIEHGMILVTPDERLRGYPVRTLW